MRKKRKEDKQKRRGCEGAPLFCLLARGGVINMLEQSAEKPLNL